MNILKIERRCSFADEIKNIKKKFFLFLIYICINPIGVSNSGRFLWNSGSKETQNLGSDSGRISEGLATLLEVCL